MKLGRVLDVPRNPFDVMDVPHPNDNEVRAFAACTTLEGPAHDQNAGLWTNASDGARMALSREAGRADGTVARTLQSQAMPRINGNRGALNSE